MAWKYKANQKNVHFAILVHGGYITDMEGYAYNVLRN
jgi:hypothetical protein